MVRLGCFLLFSLLSCVVSAKDYFGITLNLDTAQSSCDKASRVFADCDRLSNGDVMVQGNGLIRLLNPSMKQALVSFSAQGMAKKIVVTTRFLSASMQQKLLAHLREDYDLSQLTQLSAQGLVDIRSNIWFIQPSCDDSKGCTYQVTVISHEE